MATRLRELEKMARVSYGFSRSGAGAKAPGARGFSLIEIVVVIVIISLLMTIGAGKLMAMRVDAERVAMEVVLGTLRSALGIKVAETLVRQDIAALRALEGSNPMERLAEIPKNYLGEIDGAATLEPGNWYYERSSRVLIYVPYHTGHFEGGTGDPRRARFAIRLVYTDRNGNGRLDAGTETIEGVRLSAVEPYRWIK